MSQCLLGVGEVTFRSEAKHTLSDAHSVVIGSQLLDAGRNDPLSLYNGGTFRSCFAKARIFNDECFKDENVSLSIIRSAFTQPPCPPFIVCCDSIRVWLGGVLHTW